MGSSLDKPALAGKLGSMIFRGPFQTLRFCEVDLAVVMLYPDWWKDASVLVLQEVVKYLLLDQQIELRRNGHLALCRNLLVRSQKKQ